MFYRPIAAATLASSGWIFFLTRWLLRSDASLSPLVYAVVCTAPLLGVTWFVLPRRPSPPWHHWGTAIGVTLALPTVAILAFLDVQFRLGFSDCQDPIGRGDLDGAPVEVFSCVTAFHEYEAYVAVFDEGFDDRRSELGAPAETPLAVVSSEVYPDANNPSAFRAEP
ncbi:MAG: hypothetical protein AAGE52_14480, partial [Myxococcota bacterium]